MKKLSSDQLPRARKDKLIIKKLPDETLVYDLENDKAHCLNATAARVWQHCDGTSSVSDIALMLAAESKTKADNAIVWLALDQLQKFDLLDHAPTRPLHLAGLSRRQWVRNVGMTAIALPIIISLAAPSAQAQASLCGCVTPNCRPAGCPCGNPGDCVNPLSCTGSPKTCQ